MTKETMLSVRIPKKLRIRLKVEAAERGMTMAELVTTALEKFLAVNPR